MMAKSVFRLGLLMFVFSVAALAFVGGCTAEEGSADKAAEGAAGDAAAEDAGEGAAEDAGDAAKDPGDG